MSALSHELPLLLILRDSHMTHLLTPLLSNMIQFKIPKLKFQPLTHDEHKLLLHNHVFSLLIPMIKAPLILPFHSHLANYIANSH